MRFNISAGYTRLYRTIWKNKALDEPGKPFTKRDAFLYLVNCKASGQDDPTAGLKRGEFKASQRELSRAWSWSRASVRRFLELLENEKMISSRTRINIEKPNAMAHLAAHFEAHFIICNYSTYNPDRPTNRPTNRPTLKNRINKDIKRELETSLPAESRNAPELPLISEPPPPPAPAGPDPGRLASVDAYRLAEKLRQAITKRDPGARAAKLTEATSWAPDIDKLLRLDGRTADQVDKVIEWAQSPGCFWGPNILSGRTLREKFDVLIGQMTRDKNGRTLSDGDRLGHSKKTFHPDEFFGGDKIIR